MTGAGRGLADLPPTVREALASGRSPGEAPQTSAAHTDVADRLRAKYQLMVDAMIAEWHYEHPERGNHLPGDDRLKIEDCCRRQIQHEWRQHLAAMTGLEPLEW